MTPSTCLSPLEGFYSFLFLLVLAFTPAFAQLQQSASAFNPTIKGRAAQHRPQPTRFAAMAATDKFQGFIRFPPEVTEPNAFQPMQNATAYYRDFFTGGETLSDGVDGDSVSAQIVTPSGAILSFSPVTFHSNFNGQQNCWVTIGFTLCDASSIDIQWFLQSQCQERGTYTMTFFRNQVQFFSGQYQILPTIPPHKVPGDNADPAKNDPGIDYNQIDYDQVQLGDFCTFTVNNPKPHRVVGHCDPQTHPDEQIATIRQFGCALTSATMVLGYFGLFTNPKDLNTFLSDNGYYNDGGGINWDGVTAYAAAHNLPLDEVSTANTGDAASNSVCSKGATILPVTHTNPGSTKLHHHFVTTWGRDIDETTYLLKDPNGGIGLNLDDTVPPHDYKNQYGGTREFQGPGATFVFSGDVTIVLHSPAQLLITNSAGQSTGFDPITNTSFTQIPNAAYVDDSITDVTDNSDDPAQIDSKQLILKPPAQDTYTLTVTGTDVGTYELELISLDANRQHTATALKDFPTSPGAVQKFSFTTPIVAGQGFPLSGGFDGGGQRPKDVNHFLSYANPTSGKVALPPSTASFPLLIFYDSRDLASTFSATLNSNSISGLFHPSPGTFEVVNIPLQSGRNVLALSIDGKLPTRVATDTDRLEFDVQ